jgi:hypothetical protein
MPCPRGHRACGREGSGELEARRPSAWSRKRPQQDRRIGLHMAAGGPPANGPVSEHGGRQSGDEHNALHPGAAFDTTEPIDLQPPRDHRVTGGPARHDGDGGRRVARNGVRLWSGAERNRSHGTCSHEQCHQDPPSTTVERTHSLRTIADGDALQTSRATGFVRESRGPERQMRSGTLWYGASRGSIPFARLPSSRPCARWLWPLRAGETFG